MKMRRTVGLAAVCLMTLGLAACGSDKKNATPATGESASTAVPAFEIHATETDPMTFKYTVPASIKGGVVTLKLVNDGKDVHDFQLAKVVPGHTLDELLKQVSSDTAPLETWVVAAGGVGSVAPGQTGSATVDLEPGKYWYFCTESTGDGPDAVSHATHGMGGELTVAGDSGADMPKETATVVAKEYDFTIAGLKAGANTVKFSNGGKQLHHLLLFPIVEGKTFDEVKAAFMSDGPPEGEPPVDFEGGVGTAVVQPGDSVLTTFQLKAGRYVALCFMPDRGTAGPPHMAKGMIKEVTIS